MAYLITDVVDKYYDIFNNKSGKLLIHVSLVRSEEPDRRDHQTVSLEESFAKSRARSHQNSTRRESVANAILNKLPRVHF